MNPSPGGFWSLKPWRDASAKLVVVANLSSELGQEKWGGPKYPERHGWPWGLLCSYVSLAETA